MNDENDRPRPMPEATEAATLILTHIVDGAEDEPWDEVSDLLSLEHPMLTAHVIVTLAMYATVAIKSLGEMTGVEPLEILQGFAIDFRTAYDDDPEEV